MSYFIPDPRWEMPELLIPGRKPTGQVEIDWNNPITKGLKAYGFGLFNMVTQRVESYYSNAAEPSADYLRFNVSSRNQECILLRSLGVDFFDGLTETTLIVNARYNGASDSSDEDSLIGSWGNSQLGGGSAGNRIFGRYDSANNEIDVYVYDTSQKGFTISQSLEDNKFHTIGFLLRDTNLHINVDGVTSSDGTAVNAIQTSSTTLFSEVMGGNAVSKASQDSPRFDLKWWGIWDRGLSDNELLELHLNPYQFLIPK